MKGSDVVEHRTKPDYSLEDYYSAFRLLVSSGETNSDKKSLKSEDEKKKLYGAFSNGGASEMEVP